MHSRQIEILELFVEAQRSKKEETPFRKLMFSHERRRIQERYRVSMIRALDTLQRLRTKKRWNPGPSPVKPKRNTPA